MSNKEIASAFRRVADELEAAENRGQNKNPPCAEWLFHLEIKANNARHAVQLNDVNAQEMWQSIVKHWENRT